MSLEVTYATLRGEIGRFLGYGRATTTWSTDQASDIDDVLGSGLRRFYYPLLPKPDVTGQPDIYCWSFLNQIAFIDLVQAKTDYDLPDDFGGNLSDGFTFAENSGENSITEVDEVCIRRRLENTTTQGTPSYFCVRPRRKSAADRQLWEAVFHQVPDTSYTVTYRYSIEPQIVGTGNTKPHGGVIHAETIREACLAVAEEILDDEPGVHAQRFEKQLMSSMLTDKRMSISY
jgi:hypothetical protein